MTTVSADVSIVIDALIRVAETDPIYDAVTNKNKIEPYEDDDDLE